MSQERLHQQNFPSSFEEASPELAKSLRHKIKSDVKNAENAKIFYCFDKYHQFSMCLPPLGVYPERFRQLYHIHVCDLDMKHDLKSAKVINWCSIAKTLNPVKTTADGNCLLHAVSLFLWGVEDTDLFLRRLLYVSLTNDVNDSLRRRWAHNQHQLRQQHPSEFNYTVSPAETDNEWEDVKKMAVDLYAGSTSAGLPYATLEGIHIYALANILARPIIVLGDKSARTAFGQSMQENYLHGIYLPLEWDYHDTIRCPIVLGYHMNHFAPLVTHSDTPDGRSEGQNILPIWTHDLTPLPVRYTLPEEGPTIPDMMKRYLKIRNIPLSSSSAVDIVPGVITEYLSIYDVDDVVTVHRKLCELIFTQTDPNHENSLPRNPQPKHPVSNKKRPSQQNNGVKCVTENCNMFGSPTTNFLCSECFNKYTVDFNRRETEQRGQRLTTEPSAPPLSIPHQSYVDISMMGEYCQNDCGNRCSTETFPYCHECWPLFNQVQPQEEAIASMNLNNTSRVPKQTRMNIENDKDLFGQGKEEPLQLATTERQSSGTDRTNLQVNMTPRTPVKPEVRKKNDPQSMIPGTELPSMPSDISNEPASQTYVMAKSSSSEGTPSPRTQSLLQFPQTNQNQTERTEPTAPRSHDTNVQPLSTESGARKQLCAKAGCRGTRLDNNYGYCLECWQGCFVDDHTGNPGSSTVESRVSMTTQEMNDINPVITTSKQKIKCASPLCNKQIYPPHKLCTDCMRILSEAHNSSRTRSLESRTNVPEVRAARPLSFSPSRLPCKRQGCTYAGNAKFNGFCSACYREGNADRRWKQSCLLILDEAAKAAVVMETVPPIVPMRTPKPSNRGNARHCVEPNCDNFGDPNMLERCTYHYRQYVGTGFIPTPPPNNHRYMMQQEVERTNVAERDPIGPFLAGQDPTGHFRHPQPIPNVAQQGPRQQARTVQQQTNPNFQSAMHSVENMMRSPNHCKTRGCTNFSNSKKKGYCNSCYDRLVRSGGEPQREEHTCC